MGGLGVVPRRRICRVGWIEPCKQLISVDKGRPRWNHRAGDDAPMSLVNTQRVIGVRDVEQFGGTRRHNFGPVFARVWPYKFAKPGRAVVPVEPEFWLGAERFHGPGGTTRHFDNRILRQPYARSPLRSGRSRSRLPAAAKIAFAIDGGTGGTPGSPTPAAGASLLTRCTCTVSGDSGSRATL